MENLKIPHRLLLLYYEKNPQAAYKSRRIRQALAEAVLYEAAILGKIRIDEARNIFPVEDVVSGHSIIDKVSDRIRTQIGKSLEYWVKQLSMNREIPLHVTQNLIDNNLLREHVAGGFFRKKVTSYLLLDSEVAGKLKKYLDDSLNLENSASRDEITRNLIARYEII